jgi:hypothetical protein
MIALSNYSISWCQSDVIFSTGELTDSVLISYKDIKTVNSKLIELKYEKEINDSLNVIISNDNKIIKEYTNNISTLNNNIKTITKQRNIAIVISLISILSFIISIK